MRKVGYASDDVGVSVVRIERVAYRREKVFINANTWNRRGAGTGSRINSKVAGGGNRYRGKYIAIAFDYRPLGSRGARKENRGRSQGPKTRLCRPRNGQRRGVNGGRNAGAKESGGGDRGNEDTQRKAKRRRTGKRTNGIVGQASGSR